MTSFNFTETLVTPNAVVLSPWGAVPYEAALQLQEQRSQAGQSGWILFAPPPTLTLGLRAHESDILLPAHQLQRQGIEVVRTTRGGQVTYHGPSQCLGFPVGTLEDFTKDSRGARRFLQNVQKNLLEFLRLEMSVQKNQGQLLCREDGAGAGIWIECGASVRKVVAFGMKFSRHGIGHGFAINLWPDGNFSAINACGQVGVSPASVWESQPSGALAGVTQDFICRLAMALPAPVALSKTIVS